MEYIRKGNQEPQDWDIWFTKATGVRSFDYGTDYSSLTNLQNAKAFLLTEQRNRCAYCHQLLEIRTASIEHVIPKEFNVELSTNYYNLVAVCKTPVADPVDGRSHCDKEKQSKIITPFIFLSTSTVVAGFNNAYFEAYNDGTVAAKQNISPEHKKQAEAFIETLNLNHSLLRQARMKNALDGLIHGSSLVARDQRRRYWQSAFQSILHDENRPHRHFLLMFIGNKIGVN